MRQPPPPPHRTWSQRAEIHDDYPTAAAAAMPIGAFRTSVVPTLTLSNGLSGDAGKSGSHPRRRPIATIISHRGTAPSPHLFESTDAVMNTRSPRSVTSTAHSSTTLDSHPTHMHAATALFRPPDRIVAPSLREAFNQIQRERDPLVSRRDAAAAFDRTGRFTAGLSSPRHALTFDEAVEKRREEDAARVAMQAQRADPDRLLSQWSPKSAAAKEPNNTDAAPPAPVFSSRSPRRHVGFPLDEELQRPSPTRNHEAINRMEALFSRSPLEMRMLASDLDGPHGDAMAMPGMVPLRRALWGPYLAMAEQEQQHQQHRLQESAMVAAHSEHLGGHTTSRSGERSGGTHDSDVISHNDCVDRSAASPLLATARVMNNFWESRIRLRDDEAVARTQIEREFGSVNLLLQRMGAAASPMPNLNTSVAAVRRHDGGLLLAPDFSAESRRGVNHDTLDFLPFLHGWNGDRARLIVEEANTRTAVALLRVRSLVATTAIHKAPINDGHSSTHAGTQNESELVAAASDAATGRVSTLTSGPAARRPKPRRLTKVDTPNRWLVAWMLVVVPALLVAVVWAVLLYAGGGSWRSPWLTDVMHRVGPITGEGWDLTAWHTTVVALAEQAAATCTAWGVALHERFATSGWLDPFYSEVDR